MRYPSWLVPTLLVALVTSPLSGQIPPTRGQSARSAPTRLLVVTPDTAPAVSFAQAVELASGIRRHLERIAPPGYVVVSRLSMNKALAQSGYPEDAILGPAAAEALAASLQARTVVTGTLERVGGTYRVVARLGGPGSRAGGEIAVSQDAGQDLADFGAAIADRVKRLLR